MYKIFFCGDTYIGNTSNFISKELRLRIRESDHLVCNFEGPLKSMAKPVDKAGPNICQNIDAVKVLQDYGFTHFSLANNHIADYGKCGIETTINEIEKRNLSHNGAGLTIHDSFKLNIINTKEGVIGLLSFGEADFGVFYEGNEDFGYAYINHGSVNYYIKSVSEKVDILIVSVHAGLENHHLPLPLWRKRYRELIDFGVDVVIGHHPHVPQGWEEYKGKTIFYSLGNFFMDNFGASTYSFSVELLIENRRVRSFNIIEHSLSNNIIKIASNPNKLVSINLNLREDYDLKIDEIIEAEFHANYLSMIERSVLGYSKDSSLLKKLRRVIATRIRKKQNKLKSDLTLYHLFLKDTHRDILLKGFKKEYSKNIFLDK